VLAGSSNETVMWQMAQMLREDVGRFIEIEVTFLSSDEGFIS